jgi:hypothetical protein
MSWIRRIWNGQVRLAVVFWRFGVLVNLAANVLVGGVYLSVAGLGLVPMVASAIAITLAWLCYQGLVSVGIWRSAGAYRGWRLGG